MTNQETYSSAEVFVFPRVAPEWGLWRCHSQDFWAICTRDTPLDQALLLLMEVNERGEALWKLFIPNLVRYIPKMFPAPPVKLVLCPNLRECGTHPEFWHSNFNPWWFFFPKKSNLLRFWLLLGIPRCNATQRVLWRVCFSKLYKLAPYIENLER